MTVFNLMAEHYGAFKDHSSWVIVCGNNICKCAVFTLHHNPIIHRNRALFFLQSETAFYKHLPSRPIDKFLRFIYSAKVEHVCNFSAVHQLIYTTLKNVFRNLLFVVAIPQEQKEAKWAHSTLHQHFPSWYWEFKPATLLLKHLGFATILMVECYQNIEFFKV